jgi:trans-aconitate methyltransferase
MAEQYLWQELDANPTDTVLDAYHSNPRTDLLSLLKREPRRVLDIGCAGGATGKLLMQRYRAVELWGIEANPAMAKRKETNDTKKKKQTPKPTAAREKTKM